MLSGRNPGRGAAGDGTIGCYVNVGGGDGHGPTLERVSCDWNRGLGRPKSWMPTFVGMTRRAVWCLRVLVSSHHEFAALYQGGLAGGWRRDLPDSDGAL
jgi:hypothetical protein